MNRRALFRFSTALGLGAAAYPSFAAAGRAVPVPDARTTAPLPAPAQGRIPVAFLLSQNAEVIDFAGPWEVFDNVGIPGGDNEPAFELYTVAESSAPIRATGGMTIVPNYTFATAPAAKVIVIPAQSAPSDAVLAWVREASRDADLTMSVCTGAFLLAKTGLLSGRAATTHHNHYGKFAMLYPDIKLQRGARYVESGKFASAGGLSSGIDLALRVVERYFGRAVAMNTVDALEYQGQGWLDPQSNKAYAKRRAATAGQPLCPVCDMAVAAATAPSSVYRKRTYYFCMAAHKAAFDGDPAGFAAA